MLPTRQEETEDRRERLSTALEKAYFYTMEEMRYPAVEREEHQST